MHIRNVHDNRKCESASIPVSSSSSSSGGNNGIDVDIPIIYEDDWCRVFKKPQGLPTMGSKGPSLLKSPCLLIKENFLPGVKYRKAVPCHRLDSATGGILICSKSKIAEILIQYCFREKLVQKRYVAIVVGKLTPSEGMITSKIEGKTSKTLFKVESCTQTPHSCEYLTTVSLWPITGRRHQLRKQLSEIGCPILGDRRYSFSNQWVDPIDRLYLWAVELWLPHPKQLATIGMEKLIHRHCLPSQDGAPRKSVHDGSDDEQEEEEEDQQTEEVISKETEIVLVNNRSNTSVAHAMMVNIDDYFQQAMISYQLHRSEIQENILHLTIPEPFYYEEFRSQQQKLFDATKESLQ